MSKMSNQTEAEEIFRIVQEKGIKTMYTLEIEGATGKAKKDRPHELTT